MRRSLLGLLTVVAAAWVGGTGCGAIDAGSIGGGGGATPGGAEDIGFVRTTILNGGVPTADSIKVEGLFAEHDLPLPDRAACASPLCVRGAGGPARFVDNGQSDALVQIGFASNIDTANFKRKPLNLTLVVDVSGSMGEMLPDRSGGLNGQAKIDLIRDALERIVGRLGPGDRLAIVKFSETATVVRAAAAVEDVAGIQALLEREVRADASTNMEAGVAAGFDEARKNAGKVGVLDRVMLFTDAMPNVGNTSAGSFLDLIGAGAEQGIGFSAFGVGLDFDNSLVYRISHLRGGNYFYLSDGQRVQEIVNDEFDLLVTPIATGLVLDLRPAAGIVLETIFGLPPDTIDNGGLHLEIPTVFLSKRRGAIGLRLHASSPLRGTVTFADATLAYQSADDGGGHRESFAIEGPGDGVGAEATVDPPGLERLAALTNMYLAMRRAAEVYAARGDFATANSALDAAIAQLDRVADAVSDPSLHTEASLLRRLRDNINR